MPNNLREYMTRNNIASSQDSQLRVNVVDEDRIQTNGQRFQQVNIQ
jgi:hypothetical protein